MLQIRTNSALKHILTITHKRKLIMFKNYFKTAFRNLLRNKIYSFINIAGLSLGLACAMLIILYVKDEVSYDQFHKNVNNIYRVVTKIVKHKGTEYKDGNTGFFKARVLQQNIPGIQSFVRVQSGYRRY